MGNGKYERMKSRKRGQDTMCTVTAQWESEGKKKDKNEGGSH